MAETIEIVMRKIALSGSVSETVLVSLPGVESQEATHSSAILTFQGLEIHIHEQAVYHVSRQNSEDMEELMEMVATYMGSATEDEYEGIAKTIRHDLVFSEYGQEIENYIRYIPNTADGCRTCGEEFPSQAYLVCTNTGELYELDLFEKGANPDTGEYGYTSMSFGYDEVSQTNLYITKIPGNKEGAVAVQRGRGIVSVQRMKSLFCDDCIREMLETVENQLVEEFVIFDAEGQKFYAVDDGSVQIGDYELQVEYDGGDYEIEVRYAK